MRVTFDTSGPDFVDMDGETLYIYAIEEVLEDVRDELAGGAYEGTIVDSQGNTIGSWSMAD